MASEENTDTDALLNSRKAAYGDVSDNAKRVAMMWNGYLGTDIITPADMMMMMSLYKAYRFKVTPDYSDNINDVLGYAEITRRVQEATGGLIHAETTKEYYAKKEAAEMSETRAIQERYMDSVASKPSGNPYANVPDEADEKPNLRLVGDYDTQANAAGRVIDAWSQNRCGYALVADGDRNQTGSFCMNERGHAGKCEPRG